MLYGGGYNRLWVINCLYKLSLIPKQTLRQGFGSCSLLGRGSLVAWGWGGEVAQGGDERQ